MKEGMCCGACALCHGNDDAFCDMCFGFECFRHLINFKLFAVLHSRSVFSNSRCSKLCMVDGRFRLVSGRLVIFVVAVVKSEREGGTEAEAIVLDKFKNCVRNVQRYLLF